MIAKAVTEEFYQNFTGNNKSVTREIKGGRGRKIITLLPPFSFQFLLPLPLPTAHLPPPIPLPTNVFLLDIAHSINAITRIQTHGSPTDLIASYAAADIPESETLLVPPLFSLYLLLTLFILSVPPFIFLVFCYSLSWFFAASFMLIHCQ